MQVRHRTFKLILPGRLMKRTQKKGLLLPAELAQLCQQVLERLGIHDQGSGAVGVPIHAPEKPSASSANGPTQQAEARMAATPPVSRLPRPSRRGRFSIELFGCMV